MSSNELGSEFGKLKRDVTDTVKDVVKDAFRDVNQHHRIDGVDKFEVTNIDRQSFQIKAIPANDRPPRYFIVSIREPI